MANQSLEKVLPIILENKDKTEIANILRDNTQQRLDDLDKLINEIDLDF